MVDFAHADTYTYRPERSQVQHESYFSAPSNSPLISTVTQLSAHIEALLV